MSRQEARKDFDERTRLRLIEGDLDHVDEAFDRFARKFEKQLDDTNDRLGKIMWALVGLLISVTTASILIAINLGVGT
jgi:hypothetical protein